MIIDNTYFVGILHLAQVGVDVSGVGNNNAEIQHYIDTYENELLELALGVRLKEEFQSQFITDSPVLMPGADAKWTRLLDGHTYTKDSIDYYWKGLRYGDVLFQKSLIANYVYYKYVKDKEVQKTTLGVVKAGSENSSSASAIPTLTRVWNDLYKWYGGGDCVNNFVSYYYKGVLVNDYFNSSNNSKDVSLFQFILDNQSDYDNWYFTPIEDKNQFNL